MMKKLLTVFGAGCLALTGGADILLWQMTTEQAKAYQAADGHVADYAVFYYAKANGETGIADDAVLFAPGYESGDAAMMEQAIELVPDGLGAAGTSFWLELYDTHGGDPSQLNKVAWSAPITYDELGDFLTVSMTDLSPIYHPHVTPEPTGVVLLLMGSAILALRRRF